MRRLLASHSVDLVVAGDQGIFDSRVRTSLTAAGIIDRCHILGYVASEDLVALYSGAACLVFTSAYEGFGLPPLEAMACGAPVVMFDNSSLPEVAGPAAIVVTDGDVEAMVDACRRLIEDADERQQRKAAGIAWSKNFTWRRTADRTLAVYREAARG